MGNLNGIIIGAVFGIVGVFVGSISTGFFELYSDKEQRRLETGLNSYKFDYGNYPREYQDIKMFMDELQNLSIASPKTIRKLAKLKRNFPECGDNLNEVCKNYFVELTLIMREELNSGKVAREDIEMILNDKFVKAQRALEIMTE